MPGERTGQAPLVAIDGNDSLSKEKRKERKRERGRGDQTGGEESAVDQ